MSEELKDLIKKEGKIISFYLGKEVIQDPFEKNTVSTLYNPIHVRGLVSDLTPNKKQWAMLGVLSDKAKEIIIPASKKTLLEQSQKLKIDDDYYIGWKENGKLQYTIQGNYLRAYVYIKKI
jgi:hypothetical protein